MNEDTIGRRIKSIRNDLMISQAEFAKHVGLNISSLCALENDHRKPSQLTVKRIASTYSVLPEWIMSGKGPKYLTDKDKSWERVIEKTKIAIQNFQVALNAFIVESSKAQNAVLELLRAVKEDDWEVKS